MKKGQQFEQNASSRIRLANNTASVRLRRLALVPLAISLLAWMGTTLYGVDRHWTGAVNGNWSQPGNWNPAQPPQSGDNLIFDQSNDSNRSMVNDVSGLTVNNLWFGVHNSNDYQVSGNVVNLSQLVVSPQGSSTVTINCPLMFAAGGSIIASPTGDGDITQNTADLYLTSLITVYGQLTVTAERGIFGGSILAGSNGRIHIAASVGGGGDVLVESGGRSPGIADDDDLVEFNGTLDNPLTGTLYLYSYGNSQILFNKTAGHVVSSILGVRNGDTANLTLGQPNQLGTSASLLVEGGSKLVLNGYSATVSGIVMKNLAGDTAPSILDTGVTQLGLNGGGIAVRCDTDSLTPAIYGKLYLNGDTPFDIHGAAATGLRIGAAISGRGSLFKLGASTLILSGNNNLAGDVGVTAGTIDARTDTAFGQASVILQGGNLVLRAVSCARPLYVEVQSQGNAVIAAYQQCYWTGPVWLYTNLNVMPFDTTGGNLAVNADVHLVYASTLNIGYGAVASINGAIAGIGPFSKSGPGPLTLGGAANCTFSGDTIVKDGTLVCAKTMNAVGVPHNLVIGPAASSASVIINTGLMGGDTVTVNANGVLNVATNSMILSQLNLNDGGRVMTGASQLNLAGGATVSVGSLSANGSHVSSIITGNIGLPANDNPVTFFTRPYAFFFPFANGPELDVQAAVNGYDAISLVPTAIIKLGQGQMRLSGNNGFIGPVIHNEGMLIAASAPALGSGQTIVNNSAALALDGGNSFYGQTLTLNSSNTNTLQSLSGSNTWNGAIVLSQTAGFSVNSGYLQVLNTLSGPGGLNKLGPGTMQFWGYMPNSYSGLTTVSQGTLELGRVNMTSIAGDVVVGDDSTSTNIAILRTDREKQFIPTANVTIRRTGLLDVYPFPGVPAPAPVVSTLNGNGFVAIGAGTSLTVSNSANCTFAGSISGAGGFNKSGSGTLKLTATNAYTGNTTISGGVLQVDGSQPQSAVSITAGARLQGAGMVGAISVNGAGSLAPGTGPGMMTCSNLSVLAAHLLTSSMSFNLNGPTPGVQYDQLDVHGPVTISGGVALHVSLNFTTWLSNSFTIIKNDSASPVTGTFYGLPEGATMTIGTQQFRITYSGGDGNDVVLTQISGVVAPPPLLQIQAADATHVRLLWPTNSSAFRLQSCTNLQAPTWVLVTSQPAVAGANNVVIDAMSGKAKFYRLVNP